MFSDIMSINIFMVFCVCVFTIGVSQNKPREAVQEKKTIGFQGNIETVIDVETMRRVPYFCYITL